MALADDIAAALITAGIGHTTVTGADWMIFKGYLQEGGPDRAICIYETPGPPPEPAYDVTYPGFQIRVRGNLDDYQACRTKMQDIYDLLHAGEVSVGATFVYLYAMQSGVIPLGQDDKRRPNMAQNYRTMKNGT